LLVVGFLFQQQATSNKSMSKKTVSTFLIIILAGSSLFGQQRGVNRDAYRIGIEKTAEPVEIDGLLDEAAWAKAQMVTDFRRVLPTDTGFAVAQTQVRLLYNETTLFVGVVCLDPTQGKRPVESLRRDFAFLKNDNFIVFIDTYNDQTNGFAFGVSPAGAQWDGMQANGGSVNLDWDIKWRSEVKNYPDRWTAEFAIPFRSLRYIGGASEWGINFSRHDLKSAEKSSWAPMPRQFATATLAFTGSLVWDQPLPPAGLRVSVIPYGIARVKQNPGTENGLTPGASAGLDAKMILSTSMNLDLTLHPDYSQVEVDRQQTNLDRFELFFPEKRQFYLENSDLFASLGTENLRPFFSRRIGLNAPVLAGARLSGKLGSNWRIGVMDIQTDRNGSIPAANFGVTAIQKKVFRRSSVTAFLVNKVTTGTRDSVYPAVDANQVGGLEFNLASADNRWTGKAFYHQSIYPGSSGNRSAAAANITYATQHLTATLNQSWVGENYLAEVGYIRRKGYYEITPLVQYKFYPVSKRIANHGPALKSDFFFDPGMASTDRDITLMYQVEWLNKSILQADVKDSYLVLQFPFDPTNSGGTKLAKGQSFHWREAGISFASDLRKPFNFVLSSRYGGYFNGTRLAVNGELYYRIQPYCSLAVVSTFNSISLPSPYSSADFILIGPRLDITFTNKLFFTGLVQYNNQIDNINLNLRLQWRFAPVSDLYIVYTENSSPLDYRVKDRGLVVKVSYWLN
jgi:hypothetical protein